MFNLVLLIHVTTGSTCLVTGLIAMLSKKKKGRHTVSGEVYHWAYVIVFFTALVMSVLHWKESQYLFYIALFSYGLALLGYLSAKRRWRNWLGTHIGCMLGSYIGIITATLVVNVPRIPVLSDLPALFFWFLPTIIGTPLIFRVGKKYGTRRHIKM
ncbi:DUF2306 domain-containing protein [Paenibacillus sp. sptzw28]|uniref:DUF2306 domain-containing protein n=1 Tax=Paenibacillus sp. sptzw28 TaxID=715179 RepID=UPI001C6E4A87|nr:DUF2306 domain-containing protein [Paenibacillus sp. sptzw28]QYR19214.1 DUF2306 domain-containing protein [Paenibacillus sp. sptzw28]